MGKRNGVSQVTFYSKEKKRIGNMRWVILLVTLALYIWSFQTQFIYLETIRGEMMHCTEFLFWGGFIEIWYLSDKLFWVKEQGKRVPILKKYEIVPIRKRTIRLIKIRIMIETLAVMLVCSVGAVFLLN